MFLKTLFVLAIAIVASVLKKRFRAAGVFVAVIKKKMFIVAVVVKDIFAIVATVCVCFSASFIAMRMNRWMREKQGWKKRRKMRRRIKEKKKKRKSY
jgi:hypothetical protein